MPASYSWPLLYTMILTNLKLSVLIILLGVEPNLAPQEKTTFILVGPSLFSFVPA
jgi:hypothetical protein